MIIAIPTNNGIVDSHFGHSEYHTIVTLGEDNQMEKKEVFKSPQGCGCKSNLPQILSNMGVNVMLAGNMGAGALMKLNESGIKVYRGCQGDVDALINDFIENKIIDSGIGCTSHEEGHECGNH